LIGGVKGSATAQLQGTSSGGFKKKKKRDLSS